MPGLASSLRLLVQPRCGLCAAPAPGLVCGRCERELERTPTFGAHRLAGIDLAWSGFEHAGIARQIVGAAKFRARPGLVRHATDELARRLAPGWLDGTVLVPVPPDPWRARVRGFDTAAEIAVRLSALAGPAMTAVLRRRRGAPQAAKGRTERIRASLAVWAAAPSAARITLVDDVATTGTTLAACAEAARAAGACEIRAITITRARVGP